MKLTRLAAPLILLMASACGGRGESTDPRGDDDDGLPADGGVTDGQDDDSANDDSSSDDDDADDADDSSDDDDDSSSDDDADDSSSDDADDSSSDDDDDVGAGGSSGVGGSTSVGGSGMGGSSAGGSSVGGSGMGGVPGVGGAGPMPPIGTGGTPPINNPPLDPDVTLPEGCQPIFNQQERDYCDLQLECDSGYNYTSCWADFDGRTRCYCEGNDGFGELELSGVDPATACAFAASECIDPTPLPPDVEPVCEIIGESIGPNYCSADRSCTRQITTEGGVSVGLSERDGTNCYLEGGAWVCSCYGRDNQSIGFELDEGLASREVCPSALDVCTQGSLEFDGPKECLLDYISASRYDCNVQHQCRQQGTAGNGTPIYLIEYQSTYCSQGEGGIGMPRPPGIPIPIDDVAPVPMDGVAPLQADGTWYCGCQNSGTQFELQGADGVSVCQAAAATCLED